MTPTPARPLYRQWVSDDRLVTFRLWEDGTTEYALRSAPSTPWGEWQLLTEIEVR